MIFLNDDVIKPEPDKGFVKIKRVWKQSILYFFLSKRIFAIRFATCLIRLKREIKNVDEKKKFDKLEK